MSGSEIEKWLSAFPGLSTLPFKLRPEALYSIADLYDTYNPVDDATWNTTYDIRTYDWFFDKNAGNPRKLTIAEAMAARLHDATIEHAINNFLEASRAKVVGFMGGHDIARGHDAYAQVAQMARALKRVGLMIVTGGGPGLMEAANLGAFLAPYADPLLGASLDVLKKAPDLKNKLDWFRRACEVRANLLGGDWKAAAKPESANLGIPTWLYGHEPTNLFATAIGKYFFNSVREDGLITVASGGLVFGAGSAGTVQEVFQDATLNYYTKGKYKPTPMVFLGKDFWDPERFDRSTPPPLDPNRKPVFPLVQSLSLRANPNFYNALLLSDDPDEIVDFLIRSNKPKPAFEARFADVRLAATPST